MPGRELALCANSISLTWCEPDATEAAPNRSIRQILGETGRDKKGHKSTAASVAIVQPLWLMRPLQLRYQVQSIGDLRKKRAEQARSRSGSLVAQNWRGFD